MRKLVTVQTITDISPIEGADRIVKARVLGWNVVVGKDEFKVGDKAVYFEVDSFLPASEAIFEPLQARGQKTISVDGVDVPGHVLRTIKLRGVVSQGLLMPIEKVFGPDFDASTLAVGDELTDRLHVRKYEAPIPVGTSIVGPFDTRFAPKTDAIRLQTISEHFDLIKTVEWVPTVKVDGTSQTLVNDEGTLRIFSRNWELAPDSAGMKIAERLALAAALEPGDAVQFELVGPGIQANKLKLEAQRAIVFAFWRGGAKVAREDWPLAVAALSTPVLGDEYSPKNFGSVDELISFVDGIKGNITKNIKDEGVVFHPVDPDAVPAELADVLDRNKNFKVISNSWLLKFDE